MLALLFSLFLSTAHSTESAQIICPVAAVLKLHDRETGDKQSIELLRTTAAYEGDVGWGPRWNCTYEVSGSLNGQKFLRAWFLTGTGSGGTRFEFLRSDGRSTGLIMWRELMKYGAGMEVFKNYDFIPHYVIGGSFEWDNKPRLVPNLRKRDDNTSISAIYTSDRVNGTCPRDLYRAYHPDQAHYFFWGEYARRAFETMPQPAVRNRLGEPEKNNGRIRCVILQDGSGRYRCETLYRIREGRSFAPSLVHRSNDCNYVALSSLPASDYILKLDGDMIIKGQDAEVLALVGKSECIRRPGSGIDTKCRINIGTIAE